MSSMTNESGGRKMTKGPKVSPSVDESCKDGNLGGGALKKGPWTSTEDAILMDYVNKHGEGNWNAVQKHSGLSRCGKSCRLRWANHLRPDLKKGAFTPEEEDLIIKLHSQMGNKWARMAAELPGRTDNEIKNFWNTRYKRLQRAGLPIYPPGMCLQVSDGNQEGPNMGTSEAGDPHCSDLLEGESFEIPDVEFKNLELDRGIYSYMPPLLVDIPASSVLRPSVSSSQNFSFMLPTVLPPKRPRESETLYPCLDGSAYPFESSSPFDPDFIYSHQFPFGGVHGSHVFLNGNSSSSELISEAMMKSELPSLQYLETQQGSWDSLASPLPSLESVDTLIQSPPTKQSTGAECFSPRSTGLLEAVLYQSQALKRPKTSQQTSDAAAMASDAVDSFSAEVKEWEICGDHPNSHLGYAVASEFSEHAPISQSSSGESQIEEIIPGCDVKPEEVSAQNAEKNELPMADFSRPDALLDWSCFGDGSKRSKECILSDAIGALLGEDYISDDN